MSRPKHQNPTAALAAAARAYPPSLESHCGAAYIRFEGEGKRRTRHLGVCDLTMRAVSQPALDSLVRQHRKLVHGDE